ncbi:perlucin-like protein [Pecten maximus]|uniref:perlucin-like protein n=1 Tax=Pecten maximus TaxID=6579 RepID=UPI0014590CB8|nr:perlucin-like protein [Pecten maximus]
MWIPRFLVCLLVVHSIGKVSGQEQPLFLGTPISGSRALLALAYGYVSNYALVGTTSDENTESCPEGWFKRLNRCYFFSDTPTTWYGAEAQCRIMGGYLAIPDTEAENTALTTLAQSERTRLTTALPNTPEFDRWIGLRSVDGTSVQKIITNDDPTFTSYISPEPQKLDTQMCIKMDDDNNFTWISQQCFIAYLYICERPLQVPFAYNI